jgi:hypothetical protein
MDKTAACHRAASFFDVFSLYTVYRLFVGLYREKTKFAEFCLTHDGGETIMNLEKECIRRPKEHEKALDCNAVNWLPVTWLNRMWWKRRSPGTAP